MGYMLLINTKNAADNYYSSLSFSEALKLLVMTEACICKIQIKNLGVTCNTQIKMLFLSKTNVAQKMQTSV